MQIAKTFEVELTPEQLAGAFCRMETYEMSRFFNALYTACPTESYARWMFTEIRETGTLDYGGELIMSMIGDKPK